MSCLILCKAFDSIVAQLEAAGLTVRVRGAAAAAAVTGAHGPAVTGDLDVEAIKAPVKRFLRSGEKAVLDYKKPGLSEFDFEKMVDLDRGKFVCASLAAMERVLGVLRPLSAGLQPISGFPDHAYCIEYAANRLKVLGDFMTNVSIYFRAGTAAEEKFVCELQVGLRRVETALAFIVTLNLTLGLILTLQPGGASALTSTLNLTLLVPTLSLPVGLARVERD